MTENRDRLLTFAHLRPLVSYEGNEGCGFLIVRDGICEVWPVPSRKPSPTGYSIGRQQHIRARIRAKAENCQIWGTIHTHPDGPPGPSPEDLHLTRFLRGEVRAVWHPRSGLLTIYGREGVISTSTISRPFWFRILAFLLFT